MQRTAIFIFEYGTDTQSWNVDNKPPCAAQEPRRAKISSIHSYNTSAQSLLDFFLVWTTALLIQNVAASLSAPVFRRQCDKGLIES